MKLTELVIYWMTTLQYNTIYQHINIHRFKALQFRHYI